MGEGVLERTKKGEEIPRSHRVSDVKGEMGERGTGVYDVVDKNEKNRRVMVGVA